MSVQRFLNLRSVGHALRADVVSHSCSRTHLTLPLRQGEVKFPNRSALTLRELERIERMTVCVRVGLPEHAHLITAKIGCFLAANGDQRMPGTSEEGPPA